MDLEKNPEEALTELKESPHNRFVNATIYSALQVLGEQNPRAALERYQTLDRRSYYHSARDRIAQQWLRTDFEAARTWIETKATRSDRMQLGSLLAGEWAKTAPNEALNWVWENLHGYPRRNALGELVQTITKESPDQAAQFVSELPPGNIRDSLSGDIVRAWTQDDPVAAAQWVQSLPESSAQTRAYDDLAAHCPDKDLPRLAEYVRDAPDAPYIERLVHATAREMAEDLHPQTAIEWAHTLDEERSLTAIKAAFGRWLVDKSQQATAYVQGLQGEHRTNTMEIFAPTYLRTDRRKAIEWANTLTQTNDQRAVQRAIEAHISADDQQAILSQMSWVDALR